MAGPQLVEATLAADRLRTREALLEHLAGDGLPVELYDLVADYPDAARQGHPPGAVSGDLSCPGGND